jgi:hypothetical protein
VDNPTSGGFGVGRQMAARAANLNTDHTLATPLPEQDRPPEAPAATVYPPGRSASRLDGRAPWSARTQRVATQDDRNGADGSVRPMPRRARANRSRMRPLMKWKRMTQDVSGCDHPTIDSGADDHKIFGCAKSLVLERVTRAIRPKGRRDAPGLPRPPGPPRHCSGFGVAADFANGSVGSGLLGRISEAWPALAPPGECSQVFLRQVYLRFERSNPRRASRVGRAGPRLLPSGTAYEVP